MPTDEDAYNITSHAQVTYKQPLVRGLGNVAVANERKADLAATEATIKAQLAAEDTLKDVITVLLGARVLDLRGRRPAPSARSRAQAGDRDPRADARRHGAAVGDQLGAVRDL